MSIEQPYYRITRVLNDDLDYLGYAEELAAQNRSLIRAYKDLEKDLIELLDYIEPCDNNLETYSHRIYEMFLRACTEFEANSKAILNANGYIKDHYNMTDYYKLNSAMKLNDYVIKISIWEDTPKIFKPFSSWGTGHTLPWYQSYNKVKHNRSENFKYANLENLFLSIAAVQIILYGQFSVHSFSEFQSTTSVQSHDDGFMCHDTSIFALKFDGVWNEEEKYSRELANKKLAEIVFQKYCF